jgi:hypothetical protein
MVSNNIVSERPFGFHNPRDGGNYRNATTKVRVILVKAFDPGASVVWAMLIACVLTVTSSRSPCECPHVFQLPHILVCRRPQSNHHEAVVFASPWSGGYRCHTARK